MGIMRGKYNNEALMTPFKPPRKIDRSFPSTSTRRRPSSKRPRRPSSCDSDLPNSSDDSKSTDSASDDDDDDDDENEDRDLFLPTYQLTPPTSSPPLNPQHRHDGFSDSDSDSLLRASAYDILLARVRERRAKLKKSRTIERAREVMGVRREYGSDRVKKRPFIAPAVALKEEEEEEEEEDQGVGGMKMKVEMRPLPDSEVESESEGDGSDSSWELRVKKRKVFVGEAYKRPRQIESLETVMDRQKHSNRVMKPKDESRYAMLEEEELDSLGSQEDWLPSPEHVFGIGKGRSSISDSEPL